MKSLFKIVASIAIILSTVTFVEAAPKSKSEPVVREFKADIDCESCTKKIMATLPYKKGVKDVKVDLKSKIVTVKYDGEKCSDNEILLSLKRLDIEAKPIAKRK